MADYRSEADRRFSSPESGAASVCPRCEGEFVQGVEMCPDCGVELVSRDATQASAQAELALEALVLERPIPEGEAVVVLTTTSLFESDVAVNALRDAGISHQRLESGEMLSEGMRSTASPGPWNRWTVQVPEPVAEQARSILGQLPIDVDASVPGEELSQGSAKSTIRGWVYLYLALFALLLVLFSLTVVQGLL